MHKKIKTGIKKKGERFRLINYKEEIPNSLLSAMPIITLNGNAECTIEGNCSIVEYEEGIIKISFKNGFLTFLGERFNISVFSDNRIIFEGKIISVEFSC